MAPLEPARPRQRFSLWLGLPFALQSWATEPGAFRALPGRPHDADRPQYDAAGVMFCVRRRPSAAHLGAPVVDDAQQRLRAARLDEHQPQRLCAIGGCGARRDHRCDATIIYMCMTPYRLGDATIIYVHHPVTTRATHRSGNRRDDAAMGRRRAKAKPTSLDEGRAHLGLRSMWVLRVLTWQDSAGPFTSRHSTSVSRSVSVGDVATPARRPGAAAQYPRTRLWGYPLAHLPTPPRRTALRIVGVACAQSARRGYSAYPP